MRKRRWSRQELISAVENSTSIRQVIFKLGLVPAGGNYQQLTKYIQESKIPIDHFRGRGWSRGMNGIGKPRIPLHEILVENSNFQSYKLKMRLFSEGLKEVACELCGWNQVALDGRIPLELDHINGNRYDNRLDNLRILCPNCHSLTPTYRGKNIRIKIV